MKKRRKQEIKNTIKSVLMPIYGVKCSSEALACANGGGTTSSFGSSAGGSMSPGWFK